MTVVGSLAINMLFMLGFTVIVRSVGSLYTIGLAATSTHSIAKSALNGALVANGVRGSGDTSEPALQSGVQWCGLVPIYGLAAAAAEAGGEGAGFGLAKAANVGGGEIAGLIAVIAVRALGIGDPPGRSCLVVVPIVLHLAVRRVQAGCRALCAAADRRAQQTAARARSAQA